MPSLKKAFQNLNSELVRHTAILAVSYGTRLGIQAGYFIIVARALGIERYGLFVGLLALANAATPFATWGSEHILMRNVARDRDRFGQEFGVSILVSMLSGLALAILCFIISRATLPDSVPAVAMFVLLIGELVGKSMHLQAAKAFLAVNYVSGSALLINLVSLKNLAAALILLAFPGSGDPLLTWSMLYSGSTILAAFVSIGLTIVRIGRPVFSLANLRAFPYREGFLFSVNQSASSINANLDKIMLASMAPLDAAGIYAAAYRIVVISTSPLKALMTAAYAKFFKHGEQGISGAATFARQVLKLSGGYGLFAALLLPVVAPIVPLILGEEYRDSVQAIRWLAPMAVLLGLRFPLADVLSSTNNQGIRSAIQITTAFVNYLANLVLIPLLSWKGAAIATHVSDGLQTVVLWGVVVWLLRKQSRKKSSPEEVS
ncbi:MAG: oligosaccharide flippase family protein [Elainellaceae cyanobacterium]